MGYHHWKCNKKRVEDSSFPVTETGCWIWMKSKTGNGRYGELSTCFNKKVKKYKAHRFSYEAFYGPIPENMIVCHKCDTPLCVNPNHLFLGTNKDNTLDMINKNRHSNGRNSNTLSEEKVKFIRKYPIYKGYQNHLAEIFNVNISTISNVIRNKTWKD